MRNLPEFRLEAYLAQWEFTSRFHITASDVESISLAELLALAPHEEREAFYAMSLCYTETRGAPDLRAEIATLYKGLTEQQILCFAGAEEGIFIAAQAMLGPDDHAIVVVPAYQSLESIPASLCAVTAISLEFQGRWTLDIQKIADAVRVNTRAIIINFPHNPTGTILDHPSYISLVDICRRHGLYLLSDEAYRPLGPVGAVHLPPAVDVYEKALSLGVMSKAYGLPGLRIGWIATRDARILEKMAHMKHYLSICSSGPSERLALIALRARDTLLDRNNSLVTSNTSLLDAFFGKYPELFDWQGPQGGCVAYPRYKGSDGVEVFTQRMIQEHGLLLLPSSIFASDLAPTPADHFRVSAGRHNLEEALSVWSSALERYPR